MPSDPRDYKLDIAGVPVPQPAVAGHGRPFLAVLFKCCNAYARVYRDESGDAYRGRCPKCGKPVHFPVGPGGTDQREFVVG
jgi:hypothetical protein